MGENYKGNYSKDERKEGNLPQYGKKGHKPRVPYSRREVSLDEIRTNDISYWNKTSGFNRVSKFNWDLIVGNPREVSSLLPVDLNMASGKLNPPQIMTVDVVMGPGWASDVGDGVNRSLAMLMAKIRANLSTSNIGFETADLGIMLASTSSIAAMIGYAKRILECYTMWKDRNYVYPRALIQAQGFKYEDIMKNINTYTSQINALIDMYNNMSLLDVFDVYDRQYSMMHNVFADEDAQFGQLYMFTPRNYYLYNDESTPSKAVSTPLTGVVNQTFSSLIEVIDAMIQSWYGSSDLYQINGTLLRAFKDAPRQQIPHHELDNTISPVVDRAFLMQIMNCTINNVYDVLGALDITQEPTTQNYVIWKPRHSGVELPPRDSYSSVMLRLFEDDVTDDDNMELTRLVNFADPNTGVDWYYTFCGSEIVTGVNCWTYNTISNSIESVDIFNTNCEYIDMGFPEQVGSKVQKLLKIQPFRYIPCVHILVGDSNQNTLTYAGLLGDVYNWMIYGRQDWSQLQFVAYQSLWTPKNGI